MPRHVPTPKKKSTLQPTLHFGDVCDLENAKSLQNVRNAGEPDSLTPIRHPNTDLSPHRAYLRHKCTDTKYMMLKFSYHPVLSSGVMRTSLSGSPKDHHGIIRWARTMFIDEKQDVEKQRESFITRLRYSTHRISGPVARMMRSK